MKSLGPTVDAVLAREGGRRLAALTSRLTSTGTVASATFTSSGLQVTLLANAIYRFHAFGIWRTSATASTAQMRMNFGGTTTAIQYTGRLYTATGTTPAHQMWTAIANQGASAAAAAAAATTDYPWEIEGLIRVGASGGNLVHEHARAAGAGTLTIGVDSFLEAWEMA